MTLWLQLLANSQQYSQEILLIKRISGVDGQLHDKTNKLAFVFEEHIELLFNFNKLNQNLAGVHGCLHVISVGVGHGHNQIFDYFSLLSVQDGLHFLLIFSQNRLVLLSLFSFGVGVFVGVLEDGRWLEGNGELHELKQEVTHRMILDVLDKLVKDFALCVKQNIPYQELSLLHDELSDYIEKVTTRDRQQLRQVFFAC